jgi:fructokinase
VTSASAPVLVGVETGGTWCVCARGTGPDEILTRERFPTGSPEETVDRIAAFCAAGERPAALGVGAFGPIDLDPDSPSWGTVTATPKAGWRNWPLGPVLAERLQIPVAVDTDVGAAALGESLLGAGRGYRSLCYVTVGTGIGAGLVRNSQPVHGLLHPEVGHMRIPRDATDSFPGVCPAHGDCWEGLACGPAITARWETPADQLPDDHPAWALQANYMALGLLSIVSVISPHRVILGGGVMHRASLFPMIRARLTELIAGYLVSPMLGPEIDRYIVSPELGADSGIVGALALAQSRFI